MTQYELNLSDYWRIIRKRRKIIIFAALVLPLLTFAVSVVRRPQPVYEASASVKVDRTTSVTGLFLEVITFSSWDTLATQTVIIRSFPVLERVAKALGMMPEDTSSDIIRGNPQYSQTISRLQSMIKAEQEGETNIINMTVTSNLPEEAQKIANTVAEEFREYSILKRNRQVIEARKFIERQLTLVEERLKEADEALNRFREEKGVVSITEEQRNLLGRYSDLEAKKDKVETEIKEIKAEITLIGKEKVLPGRIIEGFVTGDESRLIFRLNARLSDLLLERENLLINYLPAHPKIEEMDNQIANVREEMRKELLSKLGALGREISIIEDRLKELRGQVALIPETALELSRLKREVQIDEDLFSLLKSKYQEALIKESESIEEVSIVRYALRPAVPQNPSNTLINILIGLLIGTVFGLVFAFVWESLDTSIGTIEDVEAYLNLSVLGVVPHIDISKTKEDLKKSFPDRSDDTYEIYSTMISHFLPKSIASESYRALRTNMQFLQKDKGIKTIVMTSSSSGEGKTTAVINLGITMAQMGRRVLIVDGDLRNHNLNNYFGVDREPGLSDAILGNIQWEDAVKNITDIMLGQLRVEDVLATPGLDNVSILTAGTTLTNPSEFLNSSTVEDMIKEMKGNYDYVIFDTPPVLPVADAVILSSRVDGVFIVYQVGRVARSALKRSKLILDNVNARVLGVVLNGLKAEISPDFYHMSYYYYSKDDKEAKEGRKFFSKAKRSKEGPEMS
ncbi:MAG: GumC family protein [Thermodesulfobacteriota bacterium]